MTVEVRIDERTLRELYLAPFEAIVREAGAWSVMAAYNGVNGPTMTESPLLRDILHDEWGYDGLVMSDWTAARSTEPAARAALDLAMPGPAEPVRPLGRRPARSRPGRPGRRGAHRRQGAPDPAPGRPGRRAGRCRRAAAPAAGGIPGDLRAAAAASFVLARNEACCRCSRPRARPRRRHRPERRGRAHARRRQRHRLPALHDLPARRPAGRRARRDVRTRGARAPADLGGPRALAAATGRLRPGAEVRFFSASGELAGSEQRDGATFRWMNGFGSAGTPEAIARLEVGCVIRATEAGTYRLGVSGLGPASACWWTGPRSSTRRCRCPRARTWSRP